MKTRFIIGMALLLVLASPQVFAGEKGNQNPGIIPPQANFEGKSYAEWSVLWWQWCFSLPLDGHPLFDDTGVDAANGQSGNVWFLGGRFWANDETPNPDLVTRTITIPAGTALFFPIVNGEMNNAEKLPDENGNEPPDLTLEQLFATQQGVYDTTNENIYATIDGKPVKNPIQYTTISDAFAITLPEGNVLTDAWDMPYAPEEGVVEPVVSSGQYLMVPPLSVGKHEITFGALFLKPDGSTAWSMDIKYEITVAPKGKK